MIDTQYCTPAPARKNKTPRHMQPNGKDVKAAAYDSYRKEGGVCKSQRTVMGVMWRVNFPLTRKQIVANCPKDNLLSLSSVCGRVNELVDKGYIDCNETVFDKDTRKFVQALMLTEEGTNAYKAMRDEESANDDTHKPVAKQVKKQISYAKRAGILCQDYDFCCYLHERDEANREKLRFSNEVALFKRRPVADSVSKGRSLVCKCYGEQAAQWIRTECSIKSRAQLDTDEDAQDLFESIIWDFAQWVSRRGRPAPVLKLMGAQ